ncbi:MAG: Rpn family recombination-promoting nuclease/putative transposase, partial [Lachnospiraceae bacterium]|nr:Rpn family recombination-promoting nuclease/putative transposase [Lachnospiraceae bacterium]
IEMQATSNKNLSKRSRYYQGMIDLNLIKKGEDYKILRKSYVIFICTFDPFGRELYRYEFENRCVDALDIRLEDETTKVFLNPYGKDQKISQELKDFLEYLVTHKCNSVFTKRLDEEVKSIMKNEEWRLEYMTLNMRDRENIEAGRKEGRDETIRIMLMLLNNKTPEEIADFTSIPIEVVKEVEAAMKN